MAVMLLGAGPSAAPAQTPPSLEAARERLRPDPPPSAALDGAVDAEKYVLGPGDLLEVVYVGSSEPPDRVRVTPSGRIHLSATGPLAVDGLTLAEAESRLRRRLAPMYEGTRITLDLLEVREFRVHVLGHVERPGAYSASATGRASDLLGSQVVLAPRASLRNLFLRRRDGTQVPVDLVRYYRVGDLSLNPTLEDGDVLLVPSRRDSVSVFGHVARQGFLEFRQGDVIADLLALAGGFQPGADTTAVELRRFDAVDPGRAATETLDFAQGNGAIPVEPGDGVYVRARPNWRRERLVELGGEVLYPGVYAIEKDGETLRSLIERAGGFTQDADPAGTRVSRPGAFDRPEADPEFVRLQSIPIQEMTHEEFEYLKLRSRQREGLASSILSEGLENGGGEDLVLRSGDQVYVPEQNLAVDVQGAVRNPGFVPWSADRSARDYVDLAGGKTERARTRRPRLIRARTGERVSAGGGTRVDPGDLVWVPEKQDRDWWRIARETVVFLAQVGTVIVVVRSVN